MFHIRKNILSPVVILISLISAILARDVDQHSLTKPSTIEFIKFTGNNISNWIGNNGQLTSHIPTGDAGLEWPAESGNTAVFSSGIWVVGKVNGEIRSAAAEFSSEWTPGTIPYDRDTRQPTSASPSNTPLHQIYYIQKGNSSAPSSQNYNLEYAIWPAADGAPSHDGEKFTDLNENGMRDPSEPYEDFNRNGSYDPPDGSFVTGEDPPKFEGAQMAWYVMNDWETATHQNLWNTDPIGLECQVLIYNRAAGPLYENIQFQDITLVNKSGGSMDSLYFSFWSDADLGDATDDQTGCDPDLSLGYFYNGSASDQDYGMNPPAIGRTILQGPLIDSVGDSVVNNGTIFYNAKFLEMTSFIFMVGSDPQYGDAENAHEAFLYMQGLRGNTGDVHLDPWGDETKFLLSGDPVLQVGWNGMSHLYPSDKRNMVNLGPFDMDPWDDLNENGQADFGEPGVQVIKSALIIATGADHLDAITSLKYVTAKVHSDFAWNFDAPRIAPPVVSATAHDKEIVLNWYEGAEAYEDSTYSGYQFEGYNVYQGETAEGPWTRLHTFDIINEVGLIAEEVIDGYGYLSSELVQFGDDTGLEHILSITEDALNEDAPLVNNKLYHYAFSAYAYSEEMIPKTLESPLQVFSIRPQHTFETAGVRDTLEVEQIGDSDVDLIVDVLDPGQLTGLNYQLGFDFDSTFAKARWYVTRGAVSFQDTAIHSDWHGLDWFTDRYYPGEELYLDGLGLSIDEIAFTRPKLNRSWQQTTNVEGTTHETLTLKAVEPGGVDSLAWDILGNQLVHMDTLSGPGFYWDYFVIEERSDGAYFILYRENTHDVRIQAFASNFGALGGDRLADIPGIGGGSYDFEFLQSDLEIRFTETGQKATRHQREADKALINVPFEIWDIERGFQLCIGTFDWNKTGGSQDTSKDDWENTLDLDWVVVYDQDYATHADSIIEFLDNPTSGWAWQYWDESKFSVGDVVSLHFVNPVDPELDVFRWSTAGLGREYGEVALETIQVFPNPYLGYHQDQTHFDNPYVTFSNLPEQEVIIRIYSLGGHLVKRIDHERGAYENWDLLNEQGHRVASGIYIVHIEVSDLGSKVLKLAILQPQY